MIRSSRARTGLLVALMLAIAAIASIAVFSRGQRQHLPARAEGDKPVLMLLTSLPLVFPETFSIEGGGSPALAALEKRYRVVPIAVAEAASLRQGSTLLMAHALAQPAEALVELDAWVRRGGRVLLLADPVLEWESERPLGDTFRPAPIFPDTGLLRRWGLRLDAPEERGPAQRQIGSASVLTASPGLLFGNCNISADRFVARCEVGEGRVTVLADADFLDVGRSEGSDGPTENNLEALLAELAVLESR